MYGFQLTRPRGARHKPAFACYNHLAFQLTRPRGARLLWFKPARHTDLVSIHAPVWGATAARASRPFENGNFNSRARVRRDRSHQPMILSHGQSQYAHLRRGRARVGPRAVTPVGRDQLYASGLMV